MGEMRVTVGVNITSYEGQFMEGDLKKKPEKN